ncbi:MAG: RNA methyltransferase [Clostridiales bacterium]|nr:RNA methyltransferase [Clostridiales bacterium]
MDINIISSRRNPMIMHLRKLNMDRGYRRETGLFLCAGLKLLNDAANAGMEIAEVIYSGRRPDIPDKAKVAAVTEDILKYASSMKSAPDVLFSCKIRSAGFNIEEGKYIILENVQDPGNIGTVIRTANAFNFDAVILAGACADPYGPKAVRASMGAVFRQKIIETGSADLVRMFKEKNIPLYAASTDHNSVDIRQAKIPDFLGIAIGNEGRGLSDVVTGAKTGGLRIPMNPMSESLNAAAAAAILMWELYRLS